MRISRRQFVGLISAAGLSGCAKLGLDKVARQYGAQIIDVRIKKADLPDGTPLQSAYDRMRTARVFRTSLSAVRQAVR